MQSASVIICCYNSAPRLGQTLKHLALQHTSALSWEIILVDNASTDDTKKVAYNLWQEFSRTDVPLKIVDQPIQGLSYAREKGIQSASFDILIFCDDDNWLDSNYLVEACSVLRSDLKIGALGGTGTAVSDVPLPKWFEQYKGCFACYPQAKQSGELTDAHSFLYGAGLVVKREVLQKLSTNNFIPVLPDRVGTKLTSGGDTELSYAIRLSGYKLWFSDKLKFEHYLPASRLTETYLYKLVAAMSYCSGLLLLYNYVLLGKPMNRLVWIKDMTYQIIFFIRALLSYPFSGKSSLERKLDFAFAYNRMLSILHQAGSYRRRHQQILRLKG
ncbi:MAG: glycosyltransferase family 2 protein [Cyclobacteriaceae bacterium]|nr:glycosyltransferase family 2 protein [Cyclobacteriaceae bacterium]